VLHPVGKRVGFVARHPRPRRGRDIVVRARAGEPHAARGEALDRGLLSPMTMRTMPSAPRPARFDLTPLVHPLWWAALGLLVVNDDLLKGRGIAPGWLTGKLSDFAFLVVAPVLFAAMLPLALRGRRVLATVSVVGLYVAADLSRAVSDAVVATAARVGLRWKLWPDPTDLLALAVLPATIWLLRRPARVARPGRARFGVIVGAAACLATSSLPSYPHRPFFLNRADGTVDVTVTWVLRDIDCKTTPEALAATLNPNDLDDPRPMTLASGDEATLAGPPDPGTSAVGQCGSTQGVYGVLQEHCIAAILEAPGAAPVLMITSLEWTESDEGGGLFSCSSPPSPVSPCAPKLDPHHDPGPDALTLVASGGGLAFQTFPLPPGVNPDGGLDQTLRPRIFIAPVDPAAIAARAPAPDGCRAVRDAYHGLLAATSCTTDADCQVVIGPPIPGDPSACGQYVNTTVDAAAIGALTATWVKGCLDEVSSCPGLRPAACNAGTCGEICAGVDLPSCPPSCRSYDPTMDKVCVWPGSCLDDEGETCTCPSDMLACAPAPAAGPGCPLSCLNLYPVGLTSTPSPGGTDGASTDASDATPPSDAAGD
jgi:hypothetical protein